MKGILYLLGLLALVSSTKLRVTKSTQCDGTQCDGTLCDGTQCPDFCCPESNWYCCPDGKHCGATAADCSLVAVKENIIKIAVEKSCPPDETECPAGCCP